jgi:putative ABC transport system permease protein
MRGGAHATKCTDGHTRRDAPASKVMSRSRRKNSLATIGLFGVMYFSVSQRTREFGIRAALGATRGRVMSVVLREGLRLALPGVVLGGVAGHLGARLLARALFGITPADPVTFAATAAIEITVTLAACALPAYHATRTDPVVALRADP